ncbi:glycosyl hydrolase [Roseibacillus persicicus]|nr:glycosyl hydrolase [Roseibacillus persicicus]
MLRISSMHRRQFLTAGTLASASFAFARNTNGGSAKKGWAGGNAKYRQLFNTHWYYNWSPSGPRGDGQFVPMLKGTRQIRNGGLKKLQAYPELSHLLGYNEPERTKQGNLTVEAALKFWPKLQALAETKGARLGSPAPSSDKDGMEWLDEFMQQAKSRKLKVDFVALHYYRSRNPDDLEDFIKEVAKEYRLPIWLTEFNGWSGPRDEHEDFLKEALRFLERERKVERYAYFNPGLGKPHSLLNKDGSLTSLGELYRDAGKD